jgi:hypothetical protein
MEDNTMADMKKINPEELEGVAGGANEGGACKTVTGLKDGYLAIRNVPVADYNNEVNHTGLKNGDKVLITGGTVVGTTFGGGKATYVWIYSPKYGVSGYVNSAYLK